jgi:hypothetical protein
MKMTNLLIAVALSSVVLAAGCAKKEGALDTAVDNTKDALDVRDHEKAKDAAEDVRDAAKDAAADVKGAAKDAAHDAKEAVKDAADGK